MGKRNVWVTHRKDNSWEVKKEGSTRPIQRTETQKEANEIARKIAKRDKVDRITQGLDNQIVSHDSYGKDPRRSKDTEH